LGGFFRINAVRDFFKIERLIKHPPGALGPKKGIRETYREGRASFLFSSIGVIQKYELFSVHFTNFFGVYLIAILNEKISAELENRTNRQLRISVTGPPPKTFKFDPTRQTAQQITQKGLQASARKLSK